MKTSTSFKKGHKPHIVKGTAHGRYSHGMYGTPVYSKWMAMKRRCYNKNERTYPNYGGRGITVCGDWLEFAGFYKDMGPSYKSGLSLDRINNDEGYSKDNCRWITMAEQAKNKRNVKLYKYKGRIVSLGQLEKELGFGHSFLMHRVVNMGWSIDKAISTPKIKYHENFK